MLFRFMKEHGRGMFELLTIFCQFYVITPMFEIYKLYILVDSVSHLDNTQGTFDLSRSITR